jgi:hypothetical protein
MIKCPKCRASLDIEKISFRDDCPLCRTDLHACIYCRFYDEGKANRCREPQADYVKERDRANVCEYFRFEDSGVANTAGKEAAAKLWDQLFKKN